MTAPLASQSPRGGIASENSSPEASRSNESGGDIPAWVVGDWVVFDLKVGQIKELRVNGSGEFSDGMISTSGHIVERFRPLTLRNKRIVESFDYYYGQLRNIDGEIGFNYPDISSYFAELALDAIDADDDGAAVAFDKATAFLAAAREYKPNIDGIALFRRSAKRG